MGKRFAERTREGMVLRGGCVMLGVVFGVDVKGMVGKKKWGDHGWQQPGQEMTRRAQDVRDQMTGSGDDDKTIAETGFLDFLGFGEKGRAAVELVSDDVVCGWWIIIETLVTYKRWPSGPSLLRSR